MALTTTVDISIATKHTKPLDLNTTPVSELPFTERIKLATGTGAGKADRVWFDSRTVNASTNDDLDLVGSLLDAFGDTFSPVRLKVLALRNTSPSQVLTVGAAAADPWEAFLGATGTMIIRPGATVILVAGEADATAYVCAAADTDKLRVANGAGGSATYDIVLIGVSA